MSQPGCVPCPQCHATTTREDTLLSCVPMSQIGLGFYIRQCTQCGCKFDFDADNEGVVSHKEVLQFPHTLDRYRVLSTTH